MSKHRRLLNTYNFQWIRILLCIVPLIVPNCAEFKYDEAKFKLFDQKSTDFETEILKSLQTTRNIFAHPYLKQAILYGRLGAAYLYPPASAAMSQIYVLQKILEQESDWRAVFSNTIARETKREIALFAVQSMESKMKTISKKYKLLTDNSSDVVERKIIASEIDSKIDSMLHLFDRSDSLFKSYPLIATPLLIQLAQVIVYFDPVAKSILEGKAKVGDLSCMMSNILLDYRPRAVNHRMEKVHSEFHGVPEILSSAMRGPYQRNGYSKIPFSFKCEKCSDKSDTCLIDDFGDSYEVMYRNYTTCVQEYGLFVRYRVEELYTDDLINELKSLCSNTPKTTGFGWLTIKLKHLRMAGSGMHPQDCDLLNDCDTFIKLFIEGDPKFETEPRPNTASYDVGIIYTSPKITKRALVKIEVWDQNAIFSNKLIIKREGNVDSFLSDGYIVLKKIYVSSYGINDDNHLDTISFWQDEYEY